MECCDVGKQTPPVFGRVTCSESQGLILEII